MHFGGNGTRMGPGAPLSRPKRRQDLGAILTDRQALPDTRTVMLQIWYEAGGSRVLDGGRCRLPNIGMTTSSTARPARCTGSQPRSDQEE